MHERRQRQSHDLNSGVSFLWPDRKRASSAGPRAGATLFINSPNHVANDGEPQIVLSGA